MVRTVAGLHPVSVLWRRLDARYADPLELDGGSRLGTPGMVEAIRSGSLTMVNALGSGVLESRALLAFLPRIARALLGEDADPAQHRHLVVRPAVGPRLCRGECRADDDRAGAVHPACRSRAMPMPCRRPCWPAGKRWPAGWRRAAPGWWHRRR